MLILVLNFERLFDVFRKMSFLMSHEHEKNINYFKKNLADVLMNGILVLNKYKAKKMLSFEFKNSCSFCTASIFF